MLKGEEQFQVGSPEDLGAEKGREEMGVQVGK